MRLVLVRHAQSENNRRWAETGTLELPHPDPGLSPLGERQAAALARSAPPPGWRPTHVYASLTARAGATARPLARALGVSVIGLGSLHEVGERSAPASPREEATDAAVRARGTLARLRERHGADDVVALVTHVRFTQELLRALLGSSGGVWFTIHHTGVSRLAEAGPRLPCPIEVTCLNSTAHLPDAWVSG